jgi:hypothetical protein
MPPTPGRKRYTGPVDWRFSGGWDIFDTFNFAPSHKFKRHAAQCRLRRDGTFVDRAEPMGQGRQAAF